MFSNTEFRGIIEEALNMSVNISGICGILGKSCQKNDLRKIASGMRGAKHAHSRKMYLDDSIGFYSFSCGGNGNKVVRNEEGTILAIINGEIYNATKVKSLLASRGHKFTSDIDHEVLVHIFEDLHVDPLLIRSVEGAFSFAIWDRINERLMLGVDKFGIRPLYYTSFNGKLLFASEIRGIANYSETLKKVNSAVVTLFFSYFYVPTEDTLIDGVKKFSPATYKIFRIEKNPILLNDVEYLDLNFSGPNLYTDIAFLCKDVYNTMLHSVKQKIKDKPSPVGVSLGGGLDSGLISSLLRKLNKEVVAFVIAMEGGEQNEARLIAEYNGCKIDEIFMTGEEYVRNIGKIVHILDEPIFCWSLVPTYLAIQKAKKQVNLLFTGDGGDEVFWGYPGVPRRWFDPFLAVTPLTLKRIVNAWLNLKGIVNVSKKPLYHGFSINYIYEKASLSASNIFFLDCVKRFNLNDLASIFNHFLGGKPISRVTSLAAPIDKCFKEVPVHDDLLKRYYTLMRMSWPYAGWGVRPRESICNYYGIDCAMPFIDERVVRLGFNIPSHLKQPTRHMTKYVLRRTISRYKLLPQEIVKLRKRGLADLPIATWIRRSKCLRDFMFETLDEGCSLGLIRRAFFNKAKRGAITPTRCWGVMMFILWYQDFVLGGK